MIKKSPFILLFAASLFLLSACFLKPTTPPVIFPSETAAPFSPLWAVVTTPYTAFFDAPESTAIIGYGRMGDLEQVIGKKIMYIDNKTTRWYHFEKGWLPQNAVTVYDNKFKAETAAARM